MHAAAMIGYLLRFGRKLWLPSAYGHVHQMTDLEDYQIDQGIDDLYELGLVEVREAGGGFVVELVSADLEGATATHVNAVQTCTKSDADRLPVEDVGIPTSSARDFTTRGRA
jgi:hypothetical protein